MKLTKKLLQTIDIHNPHNLCRKGGGRIFIAYNPQQVGRFSRSAYWVVCGVREQTDPGAHWMDNNQKVFTVCHRDYKQSQLEAAKAWAAEKYSITEWEKDPFGDWQVPEVIAKVQEILKKRKQ